MAEPAIEVRCGARECERWFDCQRALVNHPEKFLAKGPGGCDWFLPYAADFWGATCDGDTCRKSS